MVGKHGEMGAVPDSSSQGWERDSVDAPMARAGSCTLGGWLKEVGRVYPPPGCFSFVASSRKLSLILLSLT